MMCGNVRGVHQHGEGYCGSLPHPREAGWRGGWGVVYKVGTPRSAALVVLKFMPEDVARLRLRPTSHDRSPGSPSADGPGEGVSSLHVAEKLDSKSQVPSLKTLSAGPPGSGAIPGNRPFCQSPSSGGCDA